MKMILGTNRDKMDYYCWNDIKPSYCLIIQCNTATVLNASFKSAVDNDLDDYPIVF